MTESSILIRRKKGIINLFIYIVLIGAAICALFPIFWTVITSVKVELEAFLPTFIPYLQFQPTIRHWEVELTDARPEYVKSLSNSFIVAGISTLIALTIGFCAGYSLARFKLKIGPMRNKDLTTFIFSQIILPPAVIIIPFFLIIRSFGLVDHQLGLIFAHTMFNLPLAVLLTRDIILGLPKEIEEQAMVDGCSRWITIFRITFPLALPAIVSAGLICFAFSWNEFIFALTLTYEKSTTIPLLVSGAKWGRGIMFWYVAVRTLVALIPPIILSLFAQKYIVRGLTLGAVK
jgi:multiple sugar transport system permease protein